jgi:hypothetical protein
MICPDVGVITDLIFLLVSVCCLPMHCVCVLRVSRASCVQTFTCCQHSPGPVWWWTGVSAAAVLQARHSWHCR